MTYLGCTWIQWKEKSRYKTRNTPLPPLPPFPPLVLRFTNGEDILLFIPDTVHGYGMWNGDFACFG